MTAKDTENMASVCCNDIIKKKLLGIGASPRKQSGAIVGVNAISPLNWDSQSGLLDRSETGQSGSQRHSMYKEESRSVM